MDQSMDGSSSSVSRLLLVPHMCSFPFSIPSPFSKSNFLLIRFLEFRVQSPCLLLPRVLTELFLSALTTLITVFSGNLAIRIGLKSEAVLSTSSLPSSSSTEFFVECANHGTLSLYPFVPEPQYSFEFLNMDRSPFLHARYLFNYLVECNGELLLVQEIFNRDGGQADDEHELAISFGVFRADFCSMAWVRVESIGDHVLFISRNSFSLLASDVVGARKNCIYSSSSRVFPRKAIDEVNRCNSWTGYHLGTGTMCHGPWLPNAEVAVHEHNQFGTVWCLPRLPSLNPAAAN